MTTPKGTMLALSALIVAPMFVGCARDAVLLKPTANSKAAFVHPRLAVDPGGRIYLLKEEERDGRSHDIFVNRSVDDGKSWQKEDRFIDQDKPEGSWSSGSQIVSDGKGHVSIAWRTKHETGAKDVLFASSTDFGATVGPPVRVNQEGGAFSPEISADGKGHVYALWADERASPEVKEGKRGFNLNIYFNRSEDFGKTWMPQDLRMNGGPEKGTNPKAPIMRAMPQIGSDAQGHVYAVWYDTRGGKAQIYFRASADAGKTWMEEALLIASPRNILNPIRLKADAKGHLYVAWVEKRGEEPTKGEFHLYVITSNDFGRSWSRPLPLNTGTAQAMFPHLAADDQGHLYVAWQDARHGGQDIYANASSDFGQTWLPQEVRVNTGPPGEAEAQFPQIAIDGNGHAAIAWQEDRGAEQSEAIYLNRTVDGGRSWLTQEIRVSDGQHPSRRPEISPLKTGAFVIAWEVEQEGRKEIAVKVVDLSGR